MTNSNPRTVQFLAPNQFYFFDASRIVFQSYDTIVCVIDGDSIQITEGQPQSKTTAKYLNQFLGIHTNFKSYKDIK